jgi:hypothetical protein
MQCGCKLVGVTEKLHETANNIYAVVSRMVRPVATYWLYRFGTGPLCTGSRTQLLLRVTEEPIMAKFGLLRHG